MKTVMPLLLCMIMASCSNNNRGASSGEETPGIPFTESFGDSLIGKFVTNLYEFKLYDEPEGKVTEEVYPAKHFCGRVEERKGDWIRFENLRAIDKLAIPFSGWTKWQENDTILFEVMRIQ